MGWWWWGVTKLSVLLTDVEASLDDLFSPGPRSRGTLGEAPFALILSSFRSFPTSLLDVFSVLSHGNPLWELTWDAFCSWCFLNKLQYRSQKKYFFNVSGTIYIYKRKSLQYFTWDCADNDQFLFFFFSSIYGYSIKQPPNNSEPTAISECGILVFVAHHMFEVWHNPYGTHSICCFPTSIEAVKSVSFQTNC